jgi:hypothetical protein
MTDIRLTWLLRAIVFCVAIVTWMIAIAIADVFVEHGFKTAFGSEFKKPIETAWFWGGCATVIWGWVKKKVWIGTETSRSSRT